ncbi:MAG: FAD-binding oxidoreductase [Chloroflexota bacterium]
MVESAMGYRYPAGSPSDVAAALRIAAETGRSLVPRGSGYSYGDTSLNAEDIVVDITPMNRILAWDPHTGRIRVEAGATIRDIWTHTIGDGWWPAVVPGTMYPTVGGCLSVNVHGKNNWKEGAFAEHTEKIELMMPDTQVVECGPESNPQLFSAVAGGLGMLGIVLTATLRLRRTPTGMVRVVQIAAPDLNGMFSAFEEHAGSAGYLVGWIDGFAAGAALGRGLMQIATDDAETSLNGLSLASQDLPERMLGVVPRSRLWLAMKPTVNDPGMRLLNSARFHSGVARSGRSSQTALARFHFFHDYIPGWKRSFRPGGILQYQVFVPQAQARSVFAALLKRSQDADLTPYLIVMKRHRADTVLLGYNVNGYSLSLDYHATAGNLARLRSLLQCFTDDVVLPAGGRFYPAKDSILNQDQARASFGASPVETFLELKRRYDPQEILQSNLYRRLLRA